MNRYLPIVIIIAVLAFGAAGFFYVSSQKKSLSNTPVNIIPTSVPSDSALQKEVTMIKPSESVLAQMIPLSVVTPATGSTVLSSKILITGKTVPAAEVFVNDVAVKADRIGNFRASLTLDEGENYILVFANDEEGNYAQQEINVIYEMK